MSMVIVDSPLPGPVQCRPMAKTKKDTPRKTYALSLNRELMLEIQHLALDQDRYMNEMTEEALQDLLKKYRERAKHSKA